ncbi:hypothetical protein [Kineococcus sp. SYSU DK006]|uniref:hypothetical protein n=1 Tax=Kineococcus sp. SYSU DK006 TaxID=3383127 RepID=UPI003D7C47D7
MLAAPGRGALRFAPDPTSPDQAEADVDSGNTAALETARARDVPLWSPIAERSCFLFTGDLRELGEPAAWKAALRSTHHPASPSRPDPAFVWPADRAWCITRDVDPHYATIAAGTAAVEDLLRIPDLDIVRADPDQDPLHHL